MSAAGAAEAARRAGVRLAERFRGRTWFVGVGIVPHGARGLGLRLDVRPGAGLDPAELPEFFEGFPVQVVRIARREPR